MAPQSNTDIPVKAQCDSANGIFAYCRRASNVPTVPSLLKDVVSELDGGFLTFQKIESGKPLLAIYYCENPCGTPDAVIS
jgi:hypothetical protein